MGKEEYIIPEKFDTMKVTLVGAGGKMGLRLT
ncbi:unnamed protein product, partial [marine sediment metagenome]